MFNLTLALPTFWGRGKANDITADVGLRIFDRVANAGLCGQVQNSGKIMSLKNAI